MLGTFSIKSGKKSIALTSRPAQSLLAYLILNAGTPHRREKLAGQLWPESREEAARDYLRHALWRVRKALVAGDAARFLKADDLTVMMVASAEYRLDTAVFLSAPERQTAGTLMKALSAYGGELLPGFYEDWVLLEREHLHSVYEQEMGRLLALLQDSSRWAELLDWAEKWIALGRRPEPAYRALMSAHAVRGDMAGVAAAYDRCLSSLQELGVEPSQQTTELYGALKSGVPVEVGTRGAAAGPGARDFEAATLPVPLTSFIGRQSDIKEILDLQTKTRLLTLTGSGGVGKTRLAIEAARASRIRFKQGVLWIELAGLTDGKLIPEEILKVLSVPQAPNEPALSTVVNALRSRQVLLVLDNCEHMIADCAQHVERLLSGCPQLKVLATSRERMGLFHERVLRVPSLGEEAGEQLFAERARSVMHDFAVNEQNRDVIAAICKRLDGIPLAIELAAARVGVYSLPDMAQRLDDQLALLTAGSRTALPRHQTLRAAIAWSHDWLSQPERILFRRLALFAGGFTLEAAESICADESLDRRSIVDLLARLADKSLVVPVPGRYRMLETLRQFGDEQLRASGETEACKVRFLEFYANLGEQAQRYLDGGKQAAWVDRLDAELDNLRAALSWALEPGALQSKDQELERLEAGMRLMAASEHYWDRLHVREAMEWTDRLLAVSSVPTHRRANLLATKGYLFWSATRETEARHCLEEAVELARADGNKAVLARALGYLGAALIALGENGAAQLRLAESLKLGSSLGDRGKDIVCRALTFQADIPYSEGRFETARRLYEEASVAAREADEYNSLTYTTRHLGYLALKKGDFDRANEFFLESLQANDEVRHAVGIIRCVAAFASLRAAEGQSDRAAQLCGAVEGILAALSASLFHWDIPPFEETRARLRQQLTETAYGREYERGFGMSLEEAVALAVERPTRPAAARAKRGKATRAQQHLPSGTPRST